MEALANFTKEDLIKVLDGYFAPPQKRSMMTHEEIVDLAKRLNKKINVPLISEKKEEKILIKIVLKIDRFLYDNLPNEIYDLIHSMDKGIDDEEAKRLINRLAKLANEKIDIPYIPEQMEYIAIRFIIGIIINAARKAWNLKMAQDEMDRAYIPAEKSINESQLEHLVLKTASPVS